MLNGLRELLFKREDKYCDYCGWELTTTTRPEPFTADSMWIIKHCSVAGDRGTTPHYWKVIKQYNIGPVYDKKTGKKLREPINDTST